jgi:hypothetical protein
VLVAAERSRPAFRARWIGWKAAAAVAIAAAGGGTMLFANRLHDGAAPTVTAASTAVSIPAASAAPDANVGAPVPLLNVAGGLSDLSESDLRTLLDDMGSLGADDSFEEPGAVLPDLPGGEGV